ncbi:MAG: hypothetical protein K8R92_04790 [Planctomycetes bacterium]|nr:hypothetical protein [Planctomycetota bacterium]
MKTSITNSKIKNSALAKFSASVLTLAVAGIASPAFSDVNIDFNANDGSFTSAFNTAEFEGPWTYSASGGADGTGGWATIGQAANIGHSCTTDLTSSAMTVLANGSVTLSFDHRFSFEVDSGGRWDGGAVFVSRNGGAFTKVDGSAFGANGYNGVLTGWGAGSELADGSAVFSGESTAFLTSSFMNSVANLGTFDAGDTLRIRFRASFDSNTSAGAPSWAIDNIGVGNVIPAPGATALLAVAGSIAGRRRRRI